MLADARTDPEFHGPTPKPVAPRPRWYLRIALGLTVIGLLAWQLFLAGRHQARNINCAVNLKNIAFALYDYQAEYGALPPQYTVDADGRPLHSWRTLILPFLGEKELYDSIDLTRP